MAVVGTQTGNNEQVMRTQPPTVVDLSKPVHAIYPGIVGGSFTVIGTTYGGGLSVF